MALPKFDLNQVHQPHTQKARFKHPEVGYLTYEPMTMRITPTNAEKRLCRKPLNLAGVTDKRGVPFIGTPQPAVRTCSQEIAGVNAGCPKWAGCPFKQFPHVGPVALRVRHDDTVSNAMCHEFYESLDEIGRPISQTHMGMDGWTVDLEDITHPIGSSTPVAKDPVTGKITYARSEWQRIIPNLAPPYWPMVRKRIAELKAAGEPIPPNLALPRSAELYPELVGEDECGETEPPSASSQPSASRRGRRKRTTKASSKARRGTDTSNAPSGVVPSS